MNGGVYEHDITQKGKQGGVHVLDTFSEIFFKNTISEEPWGPTMPEKYLQRA